MPGLSNTFQSLESILPSDWNFALLFIIFEMMAIRPAFNYFYFLIKLIS
jgi:hypothetical protein